MIGPLCLKRFKPEAMLINAARGMLVDHAAVADWLAAHPQATAVLDVHDPEPPPRDEPYDRLASLPNARLLPHLASRNA